MTTNRRRLMIVLGAAALTIGAMNFTSKPVELGGKSNQLSPSACVVTGPDGERITADSGSAGLTVPKGSTFKGACFTQH